MNKYRSTLLAFLLAAFCVSPQLFARQATSAEDVIDDFVEALGGRMVLESIDSIKIEQTFSGDSSGSSTMFFLRGKRLDVTTMDDFGEYSAGFDGKRWWRKGIEQSLIFEEGIEVKTNDAIFEYPTDALRLSKEAEQLDLVPPNEYSDSDFSDCICLKLKDPDGLQVMRYFDRESGLMVACERLNTITDSVDLQRTTSTFEYQDVDGVQFFSRVRNEQESWHAIIEYDKIQVNLELEESMFLPEKDDD